MSATMSKAIQTDANREVGRLGEWLNAPWAIMPDSLAQLQEIYVRHMRGELIDIAGVEARMGRVLANEQKTYMVEPGGVAVLQAQGVMSPRANLFMQVSGGISTSMLTRQIDAMHADSRVKSVLIAADSPGGNVLGIPAAVDALRALAADKPTVLVGEGTVASAMYWLGSAANAMFIEGATDLVGSLGVVTRLGWQSPSANSIEIARGKYKRASADGKQVSPEALAQAEGHLDYLYGLLIDAVAQHRGVSSDDVLVKMADGRVFIGQQAIDAGLADGFSTVDAMTERLATNPAEFAQRRKAVFLPAGARGRPVAPAPLTRDQKAAKARAYAQENGIDFVAAFKTLGFDIDLPANISAQRGPIAQPHVDKDAQVAAAREYASEKGVSFIEAMKALGFAAGNAKTAAA